MDYAFIENPRPYVEGSGSNQFPKEHLHPEAMGALAAIVAENVDDLVVDNFSINWPQADTVPEKWKYPERIENGSLRIHKPEYKNSKPVDFSVLWGSKLNGGYIDSRLANSSDGIKEKYVLKNSDIKIIN